ncbi:MAG TPA: hypothetical protein VGA96_02745 [Fibrella sp.]
MKTKSILIILLICPLFLLIGREISTAPAARYVNSLIINGQPLDSDTLSFNSQGVLSIVEGELRWSRHKTMPYQSLIARGDSVQHLGLKAEIWPAAWVRDEVIDVNRSEHKPVPFRVSLRRAGNVLKQWPASSQKSVYSVKLIDIWSSARLGDELVVEPLIGSPPQSVDIRGKRVLKLEKVNRPMPSGC